MEDAMIRAVKRAVVATTFGLVLAAGALPAAACNPTVTMSQADQALAATRLEGSQLADANALRDDLAEALLRNDQRRASHVETQLMALMGYVADRPVSRGGCARTWSKRAS